MDFLVTAMRKHRSIFYFGHFRSHYGNINRGYGSVSHIIKTCSDLINPFMTCEVVLISRLLVNEKGGQKENRQTEGQTNNIQVVHQC